jgi:hypothetical protein
MLVASIMVTSVFTMAVTAKVSSTKSDHRLIASQAMRELTAMLRAYVTGCGCDFTTGLCPAPPSTNCTLISGPNITNTNEARWYLNTPTAVPPIVDAAAIGGAGRSIWALASGQHVITGLLPAWFEAAPYSAAIIYTVTSPQLINGMPVPQVAMRVDWTEP